MLSMIKGMSMKYLLPIMKLPPFIIIRRNGHPALGAFYHPWSRRPSNNNKTFLARLSRKQHQRITCNYALFSYSEFMCKNFYIDLSKMFPLRYLLDLILCIESLFNINNIIRAVFYFRKNSCDIFT